MSTRDPAPAADHDALRAFLATRDEPCPSCSYNLRALTTDCCPECNQPLLLRVNLAEPRVGAWVATLAAPLACGGGALICLVVVVFLSLTQKGWPRGDEFFPIVLYPLLVLALNACAAGFLVSPLGRRWFRRRGHTRQALAIAAWLLFAVVVGLFLLMVSRL